MRTERKTYLAIRRLLLARASSLAVRVALRPRGWAPGLLAVGLIGAHAPALAQETIDLASDADLTIQGAEGSSGSSVRGAGDVNGDGIDDLIIGAPYAAPNGRAQAGASYVVFGSDQGFPEVLDLASAADLIIQGAAAYDRSGFSVSGAGDVNGDGIDDLIIGAPFAAPNGRPQAGASYVILGSDQGFPATIDLAEAVNGADLIIQGAATIDRTGRSVSGAGDVNGDGVDDLIIGASASPNGRDYAGASYVVFGTDEGFPTIIDLASEADPIIQGAAAYDDSGNSVSGGDLDGDGIADLIIGAPNAAPNGRRQAGASYVILGSDQGFPATIDLADAVNGADLTIQGASAHDQSGNSVSRAGDVNGDGIDDLIIGALLADPNGRTDAGSSYLVLGARDLAGTIDIADPANSADLIIEGAAAGDWSGFSVSGAGDVDGDGIDDLIIGAPHAAPNSRTLAGTGYVVFGTDKGFPATIDLMQDADLIIQGAAAYDGAGRSVSGAGDVDGDDIDDLIIGAYLADPNGRGGAGESYVVFGSGPAAAIEDLIAAVEAAGLQPRIEKILTKTLSRALDNLNKGKESRAIITLRLFIIEVKALRGKKIDEADADEWIADARAIIDTMKAQRDRDRKPRHHAPSPMVEAQE